MAKFRQGDLVLTSTQEIIQGSKTILSAGGIGTLTSLALLSGATINKFSIDGNLTGNSDTAVPTEKAVKSYVDSQIGGVVPTGIDERIIRYNGTNSFQDSTVLLDDLGNISGINNLNVDGTAIVNNSLICNDLNVFGIVTIDDSLFCNDLNVDGTATINTSLFCDDLYLSGDSIFIGAGEIKSTLGGIELSHLGTTVFETFGNGVKVGASKATAIRDYNIEINTYGSGNRLAHIDLIGDDTYTNYGVRLLRNNSGPNTESYLLHRGTGPFIMACQDGGNIEQFITSTAKIEMLADSTSIFSAQRLDQRLGPETGARLVIDNSGSPTFARIYGGDDNYLAIEQSGGATLRYYDNNTEVMNINNNSARLGPSSNNYLNVDYNSQQFDIYTAGWQTFHIDNNYYSLGKGGNSRLILDHNNNKSTLYAGTTKILDAAPTSLKLGVDGDTNIDINQTTNIITIKGNNANSAIFQGNGKIELYHNGLKVSETTANGISGAVWG